MRTFVNQNPNPLPPFAPAGLIDPCTRIAISTIHSFESMRLFVNTAPWESGIGGKRRKKSGDVGRRVLSTYNRAKKAEKYSIKQETGESASPCPDRTSELNVRLPCHFESVYLARLADRPSERVSWKRPQGWQYQWRDVFMDRFRLGVDEAP